MAKIQHTPGPWKLCRETTPGEFVTDRRIRTHDGSHIAHVGPCNIDAMARMGHGAEELGCAGHSLSVAGMARAAIAKATA